MLMKVYSVFKTENHLLMSLISTDTVSYGTQITCQTAVNGWPCLTYLTANTTQLVTRWIISCPRIALVL